MFMFGIKFKKQLSVTSLKPFKLNLNTFKHSPGPTRKSQSSICVLCCGYFMTNNLKLYLSFCSSVELSLLCF